MGTFAETANAVYYFHFPYMYIVKRQHIYIYKYIQIYMLPFQMENGIPGNFPKSVYHLLNVHTEVCRLNVCL